MALRIAYVASKDSIVDNLTVLVVDDDRRVTHMVRRVLEGMRLRVLTVNTIREAELLLVSNHFDLLVCDVLFLEPDGLQRFAGLSLVKDCAERGPELEQMGP